MEVCHKAIPDARLVVVDGDDHLPYVGDVAAIVREVEQFLVGTTDHAEGLRRRTDPAADPLTLLTAAELPPSVTAHRGVAPKAGLYQAWRDPRPARRHHIRRRKPLTDPEGWPSSGM
jgi:hypothetical protein